MTRYLGEPDYQHGTEDKTGVLLVNLGTPDAPDAASVRRYLAQFLWDPRVIEVARPLWWLILHGVILRIRPRKSAEAYAKVWTEEGSPLLSISRRQHRAFQQLLAERVEILQVSLKLPLAHLAAPRYEFAPVLEGQEVTHDFVIQNRGSAALEIQKVRTD